MMQKLIANIEKHISLREREKTYLLSVIKIRQLKRKEFLMRQGGQCTSIYFVNEGSLRCYYLGEDSKESSIMFAFPGWWITDMRCFIQELPSDTYIQALEKTEVAEITKSDYDQLFVEIPAFDRLFRILMQNAYIREQTRVFDHMTCSAKERYKRFVSKYPRIEQLISQKHIASYLGITPEFLSYLKREKD